MWTGLPRLQRRDYFLAFARWLLSHDYRARHALEQVVLNAAQPARTVADYRHGLATGWTDSVFVIHQSTRRLKQADSKFRDRNLIGQPTALSAARRQRSAQ